MAEFVLIFDTATGNIIAKTVDGAQIAAGAIVSGKLGANAVISGAIASGQIGGAHIAAGGVLSGNVASGSLGPHIAAGGILSAHVGANLLATPHLANQGVLSASFGANVLANPHLANQGILSSAIGANILDTAHVRNQGLTSSVYGVGSIGQGHVANYGLVSGKFASGAITEQALASGISIDIAETLSEPSYRSAISGIAAYEAVLFTASGYFNWARAAQSGRAPAVGLMTAGVTSGSLGAFQPAGRVINTGWNFSGYEGSVVFLGTSSEVTRTAPAASGNMVQRLGQVIAPQIVLLYPDVYMLQIGQ